MNQNYQHSTATSLALTSGWIDSPVTLSNAGSAALFSNSASGWFQNGYWYPYYQPIYYPWPYPSVTITTAESPRPIKLTMAEVERLRVAAKKDKDLKKTLEKFTEHIEVIVDFDKEGLNGATGKRCSGKGAVMLP
jgi:hypothetical protein